MNDLFVGDEKLISTPRASEITGYSKDYIGQLCREDKVECRRVSGQWYVDEESLTKYKAEGPTAAEGEGELKKPMHGIKVGNVRDDTFNYDGVEYIATSRAASLTGYAQDYVGQLARGSEIEARKVGRRWFVGKKSLLEHKKHNDGLLAEVQAEASGVRDASNGSEITAQKVNAQTAKTHQYAHVEPGNIHFNVKYVAEGNQRLLPTMDRNTSARSTSYASDDIEVLPIKKATSEGGQFTQSAPKPQFPNSSKTMAKNIPSRNDGIVPNVQKIKKEPVQSPAVFASIEPRQFSAPKRSKVSAFLIPLLLAVLTMVSIGGYVYVYGIPAIPTIESEQLTVLVESLRENYGEVFPGATFEYRAQR